MRDPVRAIFGSVKWTLYALAILLVLIVTLIVLKPSMEPPPRRPEPSPTFYLLNYASYMTPKGAIGFEPGRKVYLVSADRTRMLLRVTDGKYEIDLPPSQLTSDPKIADLARSQDEESQRRLAEYVERQRAFYEKALMEINVAYAKDIDRINREAMDRGTVGRTHSRLNELPVPTGSYGYAYTYSSSPYSYLSPYSTGNSVYRNY